MELRNSDAFWDIDGPSHKPSRPDDPSTPYSALIYDIEQESPTDLRYKQPDHIEDQHKAIDSRFPLVILDGVLEILELKREAAVIELFGEVFTGRARSETIRSKFEVEAEIAWTTACLSSISLVHRLWSQPAQRSLGRMIYLGSHQYHKFARILSDKDPPPTIFGTWTNSMVIFDINNSRDEQQLLTSFLLKAAQNLKRFYIRNSSRTKAGWINDIFGRLIGQNTGLQHLILRSVETRTGQAGIELGTLFHSSEMTKHLQYLDIWNLAYKGDKICADFSSLRGISLFCSTINSTRTLVSLLSCISSHTYSPFETLSVDGISRDDMSAMEQDNLFTKCAALWPQLRRLHISVDSTDRNKIVGVLDDIFRLLVSRCVSLQEFDIMTTLLDIPNTLKQLPTSIQTLTIRLSAPKDPEGSLNQSVTEPFIVKYVFENMWLPILLPFFETGTTIRVVYSSMYKIEGFEEKSINYDRVGCEGHSMSFRFQQGQFFLVRFHEAELTSERIASVLRQIHVYLGMEVDLQNQHVENFD